MADTGLITRNVIFAVAAPVGSNILAASRAARDTAQAAAGTAAVDAANQVAALTAADRNAAGASALAAASSASAAAASVSATADRTVGRRLNDTSIWSMLRSTKAWVISAQGNLEEIPADTIGWEFQPNMLAPLGIQFAGARTNGVRNPRFEGAVAPSTNPTFMSLAFGPINGVTLAIAGTGTTKGRPYIDLALSGTASASSVFVLTFDSQAAGPLQSFAVGAWLQSVAGTSQAGIALNLRTNLGGVGPNTPVGVLPTTATAFSTVLATPSGAVTTATFALRVSYTSGVTYSETIRLSLPMFEAAPFSGPPILPVIGTPAAAPRAQGTVDISVAQLGTRWNRRQGILLVDWASWPGPFTSAADADWFGLASWGDGTANERLGILVNPAHTGVEARVSAGTKVTLTALPVPGWIMPGRFATSHPLFGWIGGIEVRPAALFDASLAALT
jgi:hypothetical protein